MSDNLEVVKKLIEDMVQDVVQGEEKEKSRELQEVTEPDADKEERDQMGGASLKVLKEDVDNGKRWFKGVIKNVKLDLVIPKRITIDPEGPELFAESLISLAKKYAPAQRARATRVGMNFSSEEMTECVGLPFKDIKKLRAEDIVQNMADMSQSNKNPLQLEVPRISVRITYITPPTGSGISPPAIKRKVYGGRKRAFDTSHILEIPNMGRKRSKKSSSESEDFFDDCCEGEEDEDLEDEEEEDEEEAGPIRVSKGSTNVMKNNVTEDCLFHAIYQSLAYNKLKYSSTPENKNEYRRTLNKNENKRDNCQSVFLAVKQMKKDAGITKKTNFDWYDVDEIQKKVFGNSYQILVFEKNSTIPFYCGTYVGKEKVLTVYLADGHFSGVRNVCNLLSTSYYCSMCQSRYRDAASHYKCKLIHYLCGKECGETEDGDEVVLCDTCKISFPSKQCYDNHKEKGPRGGKSRCDHTKYCTKCERAYYTNKKSLPHVCGHRFCQRCQCMAEEDHHCRMTVCEKPKNLTRKRVFFDIESRVDESTGKQVPVLFVGLRCCPSCSSHIPKDHAELLNATCVNCSKEVSRLKIIECISEGNRGVDVSSEMVEWLFSTEHEGFVAVAHNGSGYDSQFILENLIASNKSAPQICLDGTKLIYLKHRKVRLLDSLKFLNMSLSAVGKAFEIDSLKGDFPVLFIKPENFDYIGKVPSDKYYALDNKSTEARKKLVDFLKTEREDPNRIFNFYQEIVKYCYNDVYILSSAMTTFEREFEAMTQVCLLEESATAASAAVKVFRRKHLDPRLPIVLDAKPSETINCSVASQKLLAWIGHEENVQINISTTYGEKKVAGYRVDGFIEPCPKYPKGQVIEFNGCYWHGHDCTYSDESVIDGVPVSEIRKRDKKRIEEISKEYPVRVVWECEAREELRINPDMAKFYKNYEARDILLFSRALMGGRTEVFKLRVKQDGTRYIYVDVVSLYPTVMKRGAFPVGAPENVNRKEFIVPITKPEDLLIDGFLKCKIVAPQDLLLPLIPDNSTGKLVFGLCKACIREENQGECEHDEDDRAFSGVYTTEELKKALTLGYVITEVYHAVKYQYWAENVNGQGGLFTSFMNEMMTEKIYSSGLPKHVKTEEQKKAFVEAYMEKEQIDVSDLSRFVKNVGRRASSKLTVNSLWGKFAQRVGRECTQIIIDPCKFYKLYHNKAIVLLDVRPVNDVLIVKFRQRAETLSSLKTSAMHIAAYVPSYGRLFLYSLMELVGAENIIYTDTDSIIYAVPPGKEDPLAKFLGEFLGNLTNECTGQMIDFVSTGGKSYAYKELMENGEIKVVRKAKGITLNSAADHLVTFDKMAKLVDEALEGVAERTTVRVPQFTMRRNREHQVFAKNSTKALRYTFNKRRVLSDGTTLPFGYKKC